MASPARSGTRYLTSILVDAGVVTEDQVERALLRQRETGRRIGETLVEMELVSEEDIGWALSRQLGLTFVDVQADALDLDLVRGFPEEMLRRIQALPLFRSESHLTVAFADPTDTEAEAELERQTGMPLALNVATASSLQCLLDVVFGGRHAPTPADAPSRSGGRFDVLWDRAGVSFLLFHVTTALRSRAAEAHFRIEAGELRVFHRLGARLVRVATEPADVMGGLLARLHALGAPAPGPGQPHTQGSVRCPMPGGGEHRISVSIVHGEGGPAVTLRPDLEGEIPPALERLGLEVTDEARLRQLVTRPAATVVVCAPPRSGGTRALAALWRAAGANGGRRVLAMSPRPLPQDPEATQLLLDARRARAEWQEIAAAQGADVVALDDILLGDHVVGLLAPAAAHRVVLVRSDWADPFELLEFLLAAPQGRAALGGRAWALIQQRLVFRTGEPERAPAADALFEVLEGSEPLRAALRAGMPGDELRALAGREGYLPLREIARRRVEAGTLDAAAAAAALGEAA